MRDDRKKKEGIMENEVRKYKKSGWGRQGVMEREERIEGAEDYMEEREHLSLIGYYNNRNFLVLQLDSAVLTSPCFTSSLINYFKILFWIIL